MLILHLKQIKLDMEKIMLKLVVNADDKLDDIIITGEDTLMAI